MKLKGLLSDKKFVLRAVLFVIVLAVALTAFSLGVLGLSKNKEGYQVIDAETDEEALLYAHDFTFNYYFYGTSGQIRDLRKQVTSVYSGALKRAYKLTDAAKTYAGYNNIASLNASNGQPLEVGRELYEILKDAYAKTLSQEGYNMFAGALYEHVRSVLILDNAEEFDPANNPDEAERIESLVRLTKELESFRLDFIDDTSCTVSFATTSGYDAQAELLEEEGPVLDLNLLRDAYILEIVGKALIEAGYDDGYITSQSGITYSLSGQKGLEYCIYGLKDGIPAILETLPASARSVFSCFKAFAFGGEQMYYTVGGAAGMIYRNPYISALDGRSSDKYLSVYSVYDIDGQTPISTDDAAHPCAAAAYHSLKVWSGAQEPDGHTYYVMQKDPAVPMR